MKKVKKFGRGGDILTGLGAGLMGYALYKKLKGEDKDESEPEAVGGAGRRARTVEEQIGRKGEDKRREISDYMTNKPKKTEGGETRPGPDTTPPDLDRKDKVVNSPPKPAAKDVKVKPASQTFPVDEDALNRRRLEGLSKSKPTTSDTSTSGVGPKNTFLTKERLDKAQDSMRRYREEQKKKQKGVTDIEYDPMGNPIMKKGGKVKKYASGGTVKSSASKRADGIAQRGKTRGRIY
jgi:hypothetical protein